MNMNTCSRCGVPEARHQHPTDPFCVLCTDCLREREANRTSRYKPVVIMPDTLDIFVWGRKEGRLNRVENGFEYNLVTFSTIEDVQSFLEEVAEEERKQEESDDE